jgi:hypothetical protein
MLHRGTLAVIVLSGGKTALLAEQSSAREQESAVLQDQLRTAMQRSKIPTLCQFDNAAAIRPISVNLCHLR